MAVRNPDDTYGDEEQKQTRAPSYPAANAGGAAAAPTAPAPAPSTPATVAPAAPPDWTQGPWDAQRVRDYFASRNVSPRDTSPEYWAGKWNEWGKNDPSYFLSRLQGAEEFGGGGSSSGGAGGWVGGPPPNINFGGNRATAGAPGGEQAGALFNYLMSRATRTASVDPNDPTIRKQVDAYRAEQTRSGRDFLSDRAEAVGPYGSANVGTEGRMIAEQTGRATGNFEAQLVSRELQQQRDEIQSALQGAAGLLTAEQQMQLQEQLATVEAALRTWQTQQTLGLNESQFGRRLGQDAYQFDSNDQYRWMNPGSTV